MPTPAERRFSQRLWLVFMIMFSLWIVFAFAAGLGLALDGDRPNAIVCAVGFVAMLHGTVRLFRHYPQS